jgi:hypothetical protein
VQPGASRLEKSMNRRSLLTGAFSVFLGGTVLRAEEVKLPELSVTQPRIPFRPLPDYGPHVKDRRFLKDLWVNLRTFKESRGYDVTNAQMKAEVNQYLSAIDAKFPVTFIGWQQDTDGKDKLIEVTFHRLREVKHPKLGCTDLLIDITIPHLKEPERVTTHLLNIECRRA